MANSITPPIRAWARAAARFFAGFFVLALFQRAFSLPPVFGGLFRSYLFSASLRSHPVLALVIALFLLCAPRARGAG
jgi:hypothetical protein